MCTCVVFRQTGATAGMASRCLHSANALAAEAPRTSDRWNIKKIVMHDLQIHRFKKDPNAKTLEGPAAQPGTRRNVTVQTLMIRLQPQPGQLLQLLYLFDDNFTPWGSRHERCSLSCKWCPLPFPPSVWTRKLVRASEAYGPP